MTALAYIVMVLAQHRPGLLHIVDDFPNVQVISWCNVRVVESSVFSAELVCSLAPSMFAVSLLYFSFSQLASKQSYSGMKAILAELAKHMKTIEKGLESAKKANDHTFINVIGPYAVDASERLSMLDKDNEALTQGIAKVVTYLGEAPDLVEKPEEGESAR